MRSLIIFWILFFAAGPVPASFAQNEKSGPNSVTVSSVYPAPYGKYQQVTVTGSDTLSGTTAFQAKGSSTEGLVVANNGMATTNEGLVIQVIPSGSAAPSNPESGRIWLDKNVAVT